MSPNFPRLPNDVEADLSSDQFYAYKICLAIVKGKLDSDFSMVEVGPIIHSRWLTLACRILRRYVLEQKPLTVLLTLTKFCVQGYFPSWFQIKSKHKLTDGTEQK